MALTFPKPPKTPPDIQPETIKVTGVGRFPTKQPKKGLTPVNPEVK